jgi:hypothetical protein
MHSNLAGRMHADNSVRSSATTLFNADAGYLLASGIRLQLSVLNGRLSWFGQAPASGP